MQSLIAAACLIGSAFTWLIFFIAILDIFGGGYDPLKMISASLLGILAAILLLTACIAMRGDGNDEARRIP